MFFGSQKSNAQERYRLIFWNVENLFDTWNDTTKLDDEFTPSGDNHWTNERYQKKLNNICKTLTAIGDDGKGHFNMPTVVGLAEVENDKVLRDLCKGTSLRRFGYDFIHFDSPDLRGIDNALLYRRDKYKPFHSEAISLSNSTKGIFTRDILLVEGVVGNKDTLILLINHFPSKRGGATADKQRMATAKKLRYILDTLSNAHPSAAIVAMGDFNASPSEPEIRNGLMKKDKRFKNMMENIAPGHGSYKYQDHWSCLDQIIVSSNMTRKKSGCRLRTVQKHGMIFDADFLLLDDNKYLGKKVFRTYLAMHYLGGYSDHLPVYIDIKSVREEK